MQYPQGWNVSSNEKTGAIEVTSDKGAKLIVLPFFTPDHVAPTAAPAVFNTFIHLLSPNETWSQPETVGTNGLRAAYRGTAQTGVAAILITDGPQGTSGRVAVATTPKEAGAFPTDTFAQMISTLQFMQRAPQAATPEAVPSTQTTDDQQSADSQQTESTELGSDSHSVMQATLPQTGASLPPTPFTGWTTFRDPDQGSFTVEVPIGWTVKGGLVRPVAIDSRPWVQAVSPDGLITAFIGDGRLPSFSIPTANGMRLGFYPGKWYQGSLIRNYTPARQFAEQYARVNLKSLMTNIQVIEEHNRPDLATIYNGTVGATRSECATIKLSCMYQNLPAVAYYLAATKATVGYGAGMWWVTKIAGEVSPADRDEAGLSVILHMLQTFSIDPDWKANAVATAGQVSRQYTATSQQKSNAIMGNYWRQQAANESIHQGYWNRQASQDRAANNFSNYIRGQETVQDPHTGTRYQMDYGPNYHWINQAGDTTSTNYSAPGPEWRQLLSVP